MAKEHNAIFICDKCKTRVTVNHYVALPEGWSLVTITCQREVTEESGSNHNFTNYLHLCKACHDGLFGVGPEALFSMAPSTNGGIHHILGL